MKYFMFNKPKGCITARVDMVHKTVMDYFPQSLNKVIHPLGRLDMETEGLLILSDDGSLDVKLMNPDCHVPKKYYFWAIGKIDREKINSIENGVVLKGQTAPTKKAKFQYVSSKKMRDIEDFLSDRYKNKLMKNPTVPVFDGYLTITEGKKHQVKRMMSAIGCCVVYLKRVSIGCLQLDSSLRPGEYRELTENELKMLLDNSEVQV